MYIYLIHYDYMLGVRQNWGILRIKRHLEQCPAARKWNQNSEDVALLLQRSGGATEGQRQVPVTHLPKGTKSSEKSQKRGYLAQSSRSKRSSRQLLKEGL